MPSTMAVESPQDPHNRPTGSDSSLAPEDVLRAAALRSLKEKRKKQQSVSTELPTTLPPRPVVFDSTSIQLDYGQAESPSSIASSSGPPPASTKSEHKMDVDDATREEGEISDSEEPPPTPASPVVSKQQPKKSSTPPAKLRPMSPQSPQRKKPPTPPTPLTAIPRPSPITTESLRPKDSEPMTDMPPPPLPLHKNTPSIVVDLYQARPGLNMTQEQFETAKDIVLDLLGWGVPPEYLVNCGLSREIIFYVFTELDLKYPTNFDFSDLNIPESYLTLAASTPSTPQPEVVLYGDRAPYSPTSLAGGNYRAQGHPSLPQKPSAPQGSSLVVPPSPVKLSASATPFVPTTSPKLDEASLLDMEQQRRRELLARKAAISSRRKLAASSSDTATPSASTSLSPTTLDAETIKNLSGILERAQSSSSVVAKETVDDFLKSIGPVADEKPSVEAELPRVASPDSMDVDEIPGLTTVDPSSTRQLSANASLSSISSSQSIASSIAPTEAPISDNQSFRASSSEVDRRDVENMMDVDESGSSTNAIANAGSRSSSSSSGRETGQSRRAGKQRPVAADFVDFEPPRPPGYGPYRDHPRKRASFTGVTTSRRMVIELSDSEDEDVNAAWSAVTARYRPYPPTSQNRSGAQSAAGSSRAPTPAALLEKEMEIKRMREMIARREREKLKKLTTSTTSTPPAPSALANEIVVKQEEDDSASSASLLQASHNAMSEEPSREPTIPPSSVTTSPPPTPNDAALQEREDTPSIGDRVFVDPIRQQQVVAPSSQSSTPEASTGLQQQVDAVDSQRETPSAQEVTSDEQHMSREPSQGFIHYRSLLSQYPSLHIHSPLSGIQHSPAKHSGSFFDQLDLKPLKLAATHKWLEANTSRCLCQYEIPGGGECRDLDCQAIHPSKLSAIEPSDKETAEYLCSAMPIGSQWTVEVVKTALEESRQRHPAFDFEHRVRKAVASLGLR